MIASASFGAGGLGVLLAQQSEAPGWLLALGPAGAVALYLAVWQFYRNSQKSHSFEVETRIDPKPATGNDAKIDEIIGTKQQSIDNANHKNHRERVQRFQ